MSTSVVISDLRYAWPDGSLLFDELNLAIGAGRTGLVGRNGSGKSTLLRLIAGELVPTRGSVAVTGGLGYLPQDLVLDGALRVDEVLGVARIRAALAEIERGAVTEANLAVVADDWDAGQRARAALDRLGLDHIGLSRRVREVSGGEAVLLALAAQIMRRPGVLLLDEPTNNLDIDARARLYQAVSAWSGAMVIVSHDRNLLDRVDQIAEVRSGAVRCYGGNFTDYEATVAAEQETSERLVRVAESDVRRQQRELIEARTRLARRSRYGRKQAENRSVPKIVAHELERRAQVSAGRHRIMHEERLERAREQLAEAEQAVRDDDEIHVDLPDTVLPAGRTALTLAGVRLRHPPGGPELDLDVRGPERIALVGRNGAGKTTLLETVAGMLEPVAGTVRCPVPVRYLPQRLDILDDSISVLDNVSRLAPGAPPGRSRALLARFLFRGDRAEAPVGTLSGGERFRASMAALLLAEPAPQLMLLDEPTNNLDLASVRQLTGALAAYRGALIVASHDLPFLRDLGITRWLRMDGGLTGIDPL